MPGTHREPRYRDSRGHKRSPGLWLTLAPRWAIGSVKTVSHKAAEAPSQDLLPALLEHMRVHFYTLLVLTMK